MGPDKLQWFIDFQSVAAGTDEQRVICLPPGTWVLESAGFTPATTAALNATNYTTYDLRRGDTNLCVTALSTAATANTKGTRRAFTLAAAYVEFTGGTHHLYAVKTDSGTGAVLDGSFDVVFRKGR